MASKLEKIVSRKSLWQQNNRLCVCVCAVWKSFRLHRKCLFTILPSQQFSRQENNNTTILKILRISSLPASHQGASKLDTQAIIIKCAPSYHISFLTNTHLPSSWAHFSTEVNRNPHSLIQRTLHSTHTQRYVHTDRHTERAFPSLIQPSLLLTSPSTQPNELHNDLHLIILLPCLLTHRITGHAQ